MANLLYVTTPILQKLRRHKAYLFWLPIVQNFPIKNVSLDDRSYHTRDVPHENGYIYLTVDMKFVYCRDNMFSFLYEDQDLSFRFTASQGVLRTLDGKQFTALTGQIARVIASTDIELVNPNSVHHPLLDAGMLSGANLASIVLPDSAGNPLTPATASGKPAPKPKKPRASRKAKAPAAAKPDVAAKAPATKPPKVSSEGTNSDLILGAYDAAICEDLYAYRNRSKVSYDALAKKFKMDKADVKKICWHYRENEKKKSTTSSSAPEAEKQVQKDAIDKIVADYPAELCEKVVHMKNVSKKSYQYVAEKFDLPINAVRFICSQNLKRPRLRNLL